MDAVEEWWYQMWHQHLYRALRPLWDGICDKAYKRDSFIWRRVFLNTMYTYKGNFVKHFISTALTIVTYPSQYCCLDDTITDKSGGYFLACQVPAHFNCINPKIPQKTKLLTITSIYNVLPFYKKQLNMTHNSIQSLRRVWPPMKTLRDSGKRVKSFLGSPARYVNIILIAHHTQGERLSKRARWLW